MVFSSTLPLQTAAPFHRLGGRRQLRSSAAEDAGAAGTGRRLLGYSPSPALTPCGSADADLGFLPRTDKTSLGRYLLLRKMGVKAQP